MVVAVRVKQRPTTVVEQKLMIRGLLTDEQVQDRIAEDMEKWLGPSLQKLWREVWTVLKQDVARGRITPPAIGAKARNSELEQDEWWEKATEEWEPAVESWLGQSIGRVAEYQAERFGFYVDMRMINEAVQNYSRDTWWPELIKLDGDMSIVEETRRKVWGSVQKWQTGELGDRGLPDLEERLAKWFEPARAKRIAVTEATRIYAEGNHWSWLGAAVDPRFEQAFGITASRWQTARDDLVCPICMPLNSKQVLLTEFFPVNGSEVQGPPAHVGCRCWITPIKNYNRAFNPKGMKPPSQLDITAMQDFSMPQRIQEIMRLASRGTVPGASLDDLVDNLMGVRGWTPTWRKAYRKSFGGTREEMRQFIADQHQYGGGIPMQEVVDTTSAFYRSPGENGLIHMEREFRSGAGFSGFVLRHELGHSYDWQLGGRRGYASSSPKWQRAISKYTKLAKGIGPVREIQRATSPANEYTMNSGVQDIYAALGKKGAYGHSEAYFDRDPANRGTQIFANLFSLRCRKSLGIYNTLKKALPDIVEVFEESVGIGI